MAASAVEMGGSCLIGPPPAITGWCFRGEWAAVGGHHYPEAIAVVRAVFRATVLVVVTVAVLAGCANDSQGAAPDSETASTGSMADGSDNAPSGDDGSGSSSQDDERSQSDPEEETGPDAGDQSGNDGELGTDRGQVESVPGLLDDDEMDRIIGELEGQLAIGDGNVVAVARPDGSAYRALDGDSRLIAAQPTWSRAGDKLIWSSVSTSQQLARVQSFDGEGVPDGDPLDSEAQGPPVFYYQWSDDGETIMYLRNAPAGNNIEAGALIPGRPIEPVDDGAPFFVSWSPNGDRVAANVGDRSVRIYDQFASTARTGASPGGNLPVYQLLIDGTGFSAPAWIDETTVLIVLDGWLTALVFNDEGGELERIRLTRAATPVRFVVSPDRRRVAYQAVGQPGSEINEAGMSLGRGGVEPLPSISFGIDAGPGAVIGPKPVQVPGLRPLTVFDLETGKQETVTEEPALAWEWSPDGTKLASLHPESAGTGSARWRFWSATGEQPAGDLTTPVMTVSAKEALNYLPFFAQYTQSVNRWSPDSSAFAMAGTIRPTQGPPRAGIWIHLVDQQARPVLVADGDFVTWGSGPTPPATGASPA